jgi:hypothetical protein
MAIHVTTFEDGILLKTLQASSMLPNFALMMKKKLLLCKNPWQLTSLLTIQDHPKQTQIQFPLEHLTQMQLSLKSQTQIQSLSRCTFLGGTSLD